MANSEEKFLVIKAKGGLGNRMLSAVTGLIYAELTGRTPVIDWRDGVYARPDNNAYPLLFDSPPMLSADEFDEASDVEPKIWSGELQNHPVQMISRNEPNRHSDPFIYRKYCMDLSKINNDAPVGVFWCYLPKTFRLRNHIAKSDKFRGKTLDAISSDYLERFFTPKKDIVAAAAAAVAPLARPIIGVHVRYTDRKISLDAIRKAIVAMRAKHPSSSLFLATDNALVQSTLSQEFDNIHFTTKWLPESGQHLHLPSADRDSLAEAQNAMVDMWALSHCDHLIYSKHSTFSISSALIGRIPQERQIDIDRSNLKVVFKRAFQQIA